ncbi:uncharacterized protein [Blastocystis hominis]|uniref:Nop14-like protein n=1 Tax=Blastocystis hominis TaxID=12968 RepID=D8M9R4_BLAHO|nr:uncharacterized protein [Blastocystis hominis]CBK24803.2 unnamed protein product [Blastocystis hominis]|eukprot:XP_012898851.1 uncharacterized protein [Blastocystis hominis]
MVGNGKKKVIAKKMRTGMKSSASDIQKRIESNPYEMRKNKSPHTTVIGRNVKGNNRNLIVSNAKSLTQRQHAIGEDYEKQTKKNIFKDRRFGSAENLQTMTEEQKMFKKMEIQRKKQLKREKFALGDEEEELLTHKGKSLEIEDDFKKLHEEIDNDEDDEEGAMNSDVFMKTSFKKDSENPDRPRTHKEIMMEIIEKSKLYREQRRIEAEALEAEIENVDAMMDDLHSLLSFNTTDKTKKPEIVQSEKDQEYDRLTAEMVNAAKGKASDRQKTQEEIDKEEKEKLEKLEKEREERMHGIAPSKGRDTGDIQEESVIKRKSYEDEVLDAIDQDAAAGSTLEATAKDYDEDYALLFGDEAEPAPKKESRKETIKAIQKEKQERAEMIKNAKSEIPFIIPIPRSIGELCELLNEYVANDDSIHLILSRIIKNNNPNFYRNVVGLVDAYFSQNCLTPYVLDCVQGCLMAMLPYIESNVHIIWTDILTRIQTRMLNVYFLTTGYPRVSDVLLLQLVLNLFSATDFRHNFIQPALLLLGRTLLECKIKSVRDVVIAEVILAILADYSSASGRFVPEVYAALPIVCELVYDADCCVENRLLRKSSSAASKLELKFKEQSDSEETITLTDLADASIESIPISKLQASLFRIVSSLLESNASNPAALVYFRPILSTLLRFIAQEKGSFQAVKAQETVDQIVSVLTNTLNHRKHIPLQAEVLRPVYVSFAPSYEQDFVPGKVLHPNKEHIRKRELLKQVKREKRGVEREMRREAEVISEMRDAEKREIDEQQSQKLKEVMGWLEEDQANFNRAVKKGVVTGGGSKIQSNLKR